MLDGIKFDFIEALVSWTLKYQKSFPLSETRYEFSFIHGIFIVSLCM